MKQLLPTDMDQLKFYAESSITMLETGREDELEDIVRFINQNQDTIGDPAAKWLLTALQAKLHR